MRIALVVPGGVDRSGEYRVIPALLALIKRLAVAHDVHVFAFRQEREPGEWSLCGARIHNIGHKRTLLRAVESMFREHRRAPFDVIHSIWSGSCGLVAVGIARILRLPSVVHLTGGELVALPEIGYGGALRLRNRLCERVVLRAATSVTATSKTVQAQIANLGVIARRIPLGIDLEAWPILPPALRRADDLARLIHVASLNRVKDQSMLLSAVKILAKTHGNFRLDIIGEDTLGGEIQKLSQSLGLLEKVMFHGFLPQRSLRPLMEAAHINVISSRHEAGPFVMLEAAIVGVPTVGTRVGHIAEWSPDAATAVDVGDPDALATAIAELIENENLRLRLANVVQRRAVAEDADYTARSFARLYEELSCR